MSNNMSRVIVAFRSWAFQLKKNLILRTTDGALSGGSPDPQLIFTGKIDPFLCPGIRMYLYVRYLRYNEFIGKLFGVFSTILIFSTKTRKLAHSQIRHRVHVHNKYRKILRTRNWRMETPEGRGGVWKYFFKNLDYNNIYSKKKNTFIDKICTKIKNSMNSKRTKSSSSFDWVLGGFWWLLMYNC